MQPPLKLAALYAVFFLSGVCGLGYQVVWTRMLATGLGHEMPAMLAVVAAFFGGFAAGAWSLDRSVSRSPRPALWYVALEVITGFWGFLSIFLMPHVNDLALKLIGIDSTPLRHWTVALALPFIALAPATAAMGATLPALERFLAPMTADGKCVSALYSLNTFGAAAGALACTFVVTPALGFDNTVRLLSALNILCGLTVLMIELRPRSQPGRSNQSLAAAVPTQRLYVTVFFTGLLGIGYEVLGVRALGQVLEGTVYTYTVTLAVYLIGTTIGAALYHWRLRPLRFAPSLGFLLTGTATSCLFGAWLVARAPIVYERLRAAWGDSPLAVAAAELTVAVTVFGLPTVFMGAAFGHLAQWAKRDDGGGGRAIALN